MAVEEFQFLLNTLNDGVPLSQRVGLQYRHSCTLTATHRRLSQGARFGLHEEDDPPLFDTMLHTVVAYPFYAQHFPYREDYQVTTVEYAQRNHYQCSHDGLNLPTTFFPAP